MFADAAIIGAVAREVVEALRRRHLAHPVGTGPYRLTDWKRSSKIVLERNPNYRERLLRRASRRPTTRARRRSRTALQGQAACR